MYKPTPQHTHKPHPQVTSKPHPHHSQVTPTSHHTLEFHSNCPLSPCHTHKPHTPQAGAAGGDLDPLYSTSPHTKSLPQLIGQTERTGSAASSESFQRAVGAEVKSKSLEEEGQVCGCRCGGGVWGGCCGCVCVCVCGCICGCVKDWML